MGRPHKLPRIETGPKCKNKKCRAPLRYIGRKELDSSRLLEARFIVIGGKAGWGGQKLYDVFFCDKCKQTYVREVKQY